MIMPLVVVKFYSEIINETNTNLFLIIIRSQSLKKFSDYFDISFQFSNVSDVCVCVIHFNAFKSLVNIFKRSKSVQGVPL